MFPEPGNDTMGFSPSPQPRPVDPTAPDVPTNDTLNVDYNSFSILYNTLFFFALFFSLCGLAGNASVIWLLGFHIKRNPFTVYILNLAAADFSYLLCNTVWMVCYVLNCGGIASSYVRVSLFFFYVESLGFLTAVSTERCLSVLCPLWYKCRRPEHLSTITCALIWGLSFCLLILWIWATEVSDSEESRILAFLVCGVLLFLLFSVVCVSSVILVIKVQCHSRRKSSKLYLVISLTVLAFLIFGLPYGAALVVSKFSSLFPLFDILYNTTYMLSTVNSSVNPFIYFFVGRMRQQKRQIRLREALQNALMDDTVTSQRVGSSSSDTR